MFKRKAKLSLHKLFQKKDKKCLSSNFTDTVITLPKPDKHITRKENYRPVSFINLDVHSKILPTIYLQYRG